MSGKIRPRPYLVHSRCRLRLDGTTAVLAESCLEPPAVWRDALGLVTLSLCLAALWVAVSGR